MNYAEAKDLANTLVGDNDRLRTEKTSLSSNCEVYCKQIENLRQFIEELESNNKELVRFIDNKTLMQANDY